jgi:NhaA family Na+:H+ antiporter
MRRPTLAYLRTESGAGLIIAIAAMAAVAIANSRLAGRYFELLATPIPFRIGGFEETLSLAAWARSLLMPVFFLVIGMQLKFESLRGELSRTRRLALPVLAALGGLVGPASVYWAVSRGAGGGWAVGLATDGGLALAVLTLAAPGLSPSLRVLVMGVALADNLVAAVVAAILAPGRLHPEMLLCAGVVLAALALLSRWRRAPFLFYAAGFVAVWGFAMKSGLDASLAGVLCAFTVPVGARRPGQESTLKYFMDSLHPYVAFAVLPLFVLTVAGVPFADLRPSALLAPAPLGVLLALAVGKPLGVFGFCAAGLATRRVRRPLGARWSEIGAISILCGVGLAVSSFAVGVDGVGAAAEAAVLAASALAAVAGFGLLAWTEERRVSDEVEPG